MYTVELWAGETLQVEFEGQMPEIRLNGEAIPAEMVEYLFRYGIRQSVKDKAAGAETDAERNALAQKRIDALIDGSVREGTGGGPKLSPLERRARDIAQRDVEAAARKLGHKLTRKDVANRAAAYFKSHGDRLRTRAEAELAAETPDADLMALLTGGDED